eukprot:jgi/Mesvir1/8745/Mv25009-RA.2
MDAGETRQLKCGVLGATGRVGQWLIYYLDSHPSFQIATIAASPASTGKTLRDAANGNKIAENTSAWQMKLQSSSPENFTSCDIVFSALPASVAGPIEDALSASGRPVFTLARPSLSDPLSACICPPKGRSPVVGCGGESFALTLSIALRPLVDGFDVRDVHVVCMRNGSKKNADPEKPCECEVSASHALLGNLLGVSANPGGPHQPLPLELTSECYHDMSSSQALLSVSGTIHGATTAADLSSTWQTHSSSSRYIRLVQGPSSSSQLLAGADASVIVSRVSARGHSSTLPAGAPPATPTAPTTRFGFTASWADTSAASARSALYIAELAVAAGHVTLLSVPALAAAGPAKAAMIGGGVTINPGDRPRDWSLHRVREGEGGPTGDVLDDAVAALSGAATPMVRPNVHKFGGSSLADAECFRNVAGLLKHELARTQGRPLAVVVSAMKGVTDLLLDAVRHAKLHNREAARASLRTAVSKYEVAAKELLPAAPLDDANASESDARDGAASEAESRDGSSATDRDGYCAALKLDEVHVKEMLHACSLVSTIADAIEGLVAGHGEVWSMQLLSAYLRSLGWAAIGLNAQDVLVVEHSAGMCNVKWEVSRSRLSSWLAASARSADAMVVTGFVAKDLEGNSTTLGRNGSDYSASIFAALLNANSMQIWKEVKGVMSADPTKVPNAFVLDEVSYDEAMEMSFFGASILHPLTMLPAVQHNIPIRIRCTFDASAPGTKICANVAPTAASAKLVVKGISFMKGLALLDLSGNAMMGVPGIAERCFGALRQAAVSVVLISQASSEHSICFAVPEDQAARSKAAVEDAFALEMHKGMVNPVLIMPQCAILGVVGDGMR